MGELRRFSTMKLALIVGMLMVVACQKPATKSEVINPVMPQPLAQPTAQRPHLISLSLSPRGNDGGSPAVVYHQAILRVVSPAGIATEHELPMLEGDCSPDGMLSIRCMAHGYFQTLELTIEGAAIRVTLNSHECGADSPPPQVESIELAKGAVVRVADEG